MFTIVKRGEAPGPDSISNEILKCCVLLLIYWPDDWRRSCIVPLFKAGELCGKVMTLVLAGRLSKFSEGQGVFRLGRGCVDQV